MVYITFRATYMIEYGRDTSYLNLGIRELNHLTCDFSNTLYGFQCIDSFYPSHKCGSP